MLMRMEPTQVKNAVNRYAAMDRAKNTMPTRPEARPSGNDRNPE